MNWTDRVHINTHYTRSVNLERDASSEDVVRAYIPTSRSLQVLNRIGASLSHEAIPRAWALIGPYGSGKSSFGIFLYHLLGDPTKKPTKSASKVLYSAESGLARTFNAATKNTSGHCAILLTGSPEPLGKRLIQAIHKGALAYWQNRRGRTPVIVKVLEDAARSGKTSTSDIIKLLGELQTSVAKSGGSGIVLIIDELGKFLEYEARNYDVNDIFLLQAIAEHACRASSAPLHLIVLLHQSFEQYTRGLGDRLRTEWQKVQGRFESVPFLESTEQVLRIMRATFSHKLDNKLSTRITESTRFLSKQLADASALPGSMNAATATNLFVGCYPLHPVSLLILPILCQRVAQNERTLFSYLGSQEPYGFRDSLSRMDASSRGLSWVLPWEIYEYFILNQPAAVSDHSTHRRWAEVVTAVERLGDANGDDVNLLKTIGLINIVGAQGGLKASKDILRLCVQQTSAESNKKIDKVLNRLAEKSLVTFRKFNNEYRIWQGSDFDLEGALQDELNQLSSLNLPAVLNERQPLAPLVARRYTIKTGALRYFSPVFIDKTEVKRPNSEANPPQIFVFLADSAEEQKELALLAQNNSGGLVIAVVCLNGAEIRQATFEVLALERIQHSYPGLANDPVAQRELKDRLIAARAVEQALLKGILDEPNRSIWYWGKQKLGVRDRRALQVELSNILEHVYRDAPLIRNELINRDKLSSAAAAGRNKLLEAMLERADQKDMGIEKYPPEKSIYRSLLLASGLHRERNDTWDFSVPFPRNDRSRILPVWRSMDTFFSGSEREALPVAELFSKLSSPPYGVKSGILPILFVAACLSNEHELALYEDGLFCPTLNIEILGRLIKNPNAFSVQRFKVAGMRASLYEKYMEVITGEKRENPGMLDIARPLAKFMVRLPEYSKRTKSLSKKALAVRQAFFVAKSPARLLFQDIPAACGFVPFSAKKTDRHLADQFARSFVNVLRELKSAYPELLQLLQKKLMAAFPDCRASDISSLRNHLSGRYVGLDKYTIDTEGLKAFLSRLCDPHGDDKHWLESLASFLARKPAEKWADEDLQFVDFRLAEFSKRARDLEKLRIAYEDNKTPMSSGFEAVLFRVVRQNKGEQERVVYVDDKRRQIFLHTLPNIRTELAKLPDEQHQLALLAELADQVMERLRDNEQQASPKPKKHKGRAA